MIAVVIEGDQRSALAVTRSLGRKGVRVAVGAQAARSLASSSRYCSQSFTYPSPYSSPDEFVRAVIAETSRLGESVLLPITDVALSEILRRKGEFPDNVRIPFVPYEEYLAASDKSKLMGLAKRLNVPIPATVFPAGCRDREDILERAAGLGFPLVVKPSLSRIRAPGGWLNTSVQYARDPETLKELLGKEPFRSFPFIIQERIEGPGMGIFVLAKDGEAVATFAHRRVREKPPSGGVSVLCESIPVPADAFESAKRLLKELNWTGIAMVEFKQDSRDGVPRLMEINARFWGSLQLAITAGVDFPYLLFCMASGQEAGRTDGYETGLRSRWELGDLDHLLLRMRKSPSRLSLPPNAPSRQKVLRDFIADFFSPSVKNEVLRLEDPGPFIFEVKEYLKNIIRR